MASMDRPDDGGMAPRRNAQRGVGDGHGAAVPRREEQVMKLNIALQRHNGQNPYGDWLRQGEEDDLHGDIPAHAYEDAIDEALETGAEEGHIVSGGQHYDWREA